MSPFKMLERGKAPTLLQAGLANQVLALLNGLIRAQVQPSAAGKFVVTEGGVVLDLTASQAATQAQQIADMNKAIAALQGQVTAINKSLRAATITCDGGSVIITFPALP